jgi:hypothetical protein
MTWTDYTQSGGVEKSKYNAGALKIERLNSSWVRCKTHWRQGNYSELNEELDLIWFELEADATKKEIADIESLDKEIIKLKQERIPEYKKINRHFAIMKTKWKLLFRIEKHQGLGKKYVDASDEELS